MFLFPYWVCMFLTGRLWQRWCPSNSHCFTFPQLLGHVPTLFSLGVSVFVRWHKGLDRWFKGRELILPRAGSLWFTVQPYKPWGKAAEGVMHRDYEYSGHWIIKSWLELHQGLPSKYQNFGKESLWQCFIRHTEFQFCEQRFRSSKAKWHFNWKIKC